ncbi:MAG: hypothetical protein ABI433_09975 [Burkholderiaceae bacterium]
MCIVGRLTRQPVVRISTDGHPHLSVEVRQAGDCLPFVACRHGAADDRGDFEALAARLGVDASVLILGAGLAVEPDQADDVAIPIEVTAWRRLRLVECKAIRELHIADPVEAALL